MKQILGIICIALLVTACKQEYKDTNENSSTNKAELTVVMQKHLDAVSNKDIETLKSTMSPNGDMLLILPQSEIMEGVDAFIEYHTEWFAVDNGWTFETKILDTKVGGVFGMAITEIVYREPERDGKPYFNRMIVSYDLKKIKGNWYVVKDHASSVEKSTDIIEPHTNSELPDPYQAGWKGEKVCEILEDNEELRVLRCTFPPGLGHEKHYHNPHFGYALVGGTFKLEEASGIREVSFPTGYSWSKDEVSEHQVLNTGDSISVFLIIEYK